MTTSILSKSNYLKGCQCNKLLWLKTHTPHIFPKEDKLTSFIYNQGHLVGEYAKKKFPNADEIKDIPFIEKITKTKELMKKKQTIFEASFLYDQCFCMVDILNFNNGRWDIIEVKSSTNLKKTHLKDIGFQTYILKQLKVPIGQCYILHINTKYNRKKRLDLEQLFNQVDVTNQLNMSLIKQNIKPFKTTLKSKEEPTIPIGEHCLSPFKCDAYNHCWKTLANKTIFELNSTPLIQKLDYFFQNKYQLTDLSIKDFPKRNQKIQLSCEKEQLDFVNIPKISQFISNLKFPISYLDIEAFQTAIPQYPNSIPYQQMPFQYSLHIQTNKRLRHHEFIGTGKKDPRLPLIKSLIKNLPKRGPIIVFSRQLETLVLNEIGDIYPQLKKQIKSITRRFVDLAIPFQHYHIYLRAMNGKTSLKSIVSALAPELSYDELDINSGAYANIAYQELMADNKKTEIIDQLKKYCFLDTFSMIKIIENLKRVIGLR